MTTRTHLQHLDAHQDPHQDAHKDAPPSAASAAVPPPALRVHPSSTPDQVVLDAESLRQACLRAGADDVGFVALEREELDGERQDILNAFPRARTLISFVVSMNRAAIRSPMRSIANLEFHHAGDETNDIARRIVDTLHTAGAEGLNPAMGFPMEMDRFPGKIWVVSHKLVAQAAGLGVMGIHRNVIHPKLGNFILLGTVVTDALVSEEGAPLDANPCFECKLCVAACPVGAIGKDGSFQFDACYTHNYREFMGGFSDWVGQVVESKDRADYHEKVTHAESASVWQSLSFGANYKAAYCMSVCPAGTDVIGPYLKSRKAFVSETLRPLQDKEENVYVVRGTDAERYVTKRFPHKRVRLVQSSLQPTSIDGLLASMPLVFQAGQAEGLNATFHFDFVGDETRQATIRVREQTLSIVRELEGEPDLVVRADSATWLAFLRGERSMARALITRKVKLSGPVALLRAFGRCFPT